MVEIKGGEFKGEDSRVKIGVGTRFKAEKNGEEFIICQVLPRKLCVVCLTSGNREADPVEVEDARWITRDEFKEMFGNYPFRSLTLC